MADPYAQIDAVRDARVNAVNNAYTDTSKPDVPSWKPAVLKHAWLLNDGKRLPVVNLFHPALEHDALKFLRDFDELCAAIPWNDSQREYIGKLLAPEGGLPLISCSPAAGKGALMVHTSNFAETNGMKVLITGMEESSLNRFGEEYCRTFPHAQSPVLVTSVPDVLPPIYQAPETDKHEILMFHAMLELDEHLGPSICGERSFTIEAKIKQLLDDPDSKTIMRHFTIGYDEVRKTDIVDGEKRDMVQYLRDAMPKLKEHHIIDDSYWSVGVRRRLCQAIKHCRAQVIQDAKILICTCYISGKKEISKYFATDVDTVVLIFDEARTCTEPDALIAIATPDFARKIDAVIMFGDISGRGPIPSLHPQMNISLFERLVRTGHPLLVLSDQN
ncbi:hypothetical protein QM012_002057 [Aureobasidium pullulans]|uniref:DNA2/NAM7 helicase helicase domain-containing protein n=1 Tax=Aureobasidium pullulans TaxID=5580 RepID=A0ABR0TD97_AURPU